MSNRLLRTKLSPILKLCLAALFVALTTILQKVLAINYIPVVPFLRISLGGPAVIIFSSIFLGPWYGLLVGLGSDVLGYFLLDQSGQVFFPQITAIYGLLGFSSFFIFLLFRNIKQRSTMIIIEIASLLLIFISLSMYLVLNDSITLYSSIYNLDTIQKVIIPIIVFLSLIFIVLFTFLWDKRMRKEAVQPPFNAFQISFSLFIIELIVMVLFGTFMKGLAFGFQTYIAILACQIIVLFINVPLNTMLISLLLKVTRKWFNRNTENKGE